MRSFKYLVVLLLAFLIVACGGGGGTASEADTPAPDTGAGELTEAQPELPTDLQEAPEEAPAQQTEGNTLQTVLDRGQLICGVNDQLPGFGSLAASGEYSGFDVDFCRAIAAALFDDANAVQFRPLTAQERFTAVQTGEVDVLVRNTTWTLTRDTEVGMDFAPTIFYDGQGMMVRKDSGINAIDDMNGATVCVQSGTTTELNLADNFRARNLEFTPVVFNENNQVLEAYDSGQCDGFTTDKSGLVASQTKLSNPDDHKILDDTMSKEPLAPAVRQGDAQWRDIVTWVVYATIQAEEFGINQDNLDEFLESENPNIRRFLGLEDEFGAHLGLENDFVQRIIRGVGNFADIYNRNLGPDTPFDLPRGQNSLYTEGGLLYAPPFR